MEALNDVLDEYFSQYRFTSPYLATCKVPQCNYIAFNQSDSYSGTTANCCVPGLGV